MSTSPKRHRGFRSRLERFVLGIGMGIAAFVIERRILRSIKAKGEAPPSPKEDAFDELINEGVRISD